MEAPEYRGDGIRCPARRQTPTPLGEQILPPRNIEVRDFDCLDSNTPMLMRHSRDEIMALCEEAAETNESPDLGPPPVSRFVDEDPVKIDLPTKSPSAIRNVYALEDSPSAPARRNVVEEHVVAVKKVQTLESIEKAEEAYLSPVENEKTGRFDPTHAAVEVEALTPTKKLEPKIIKPTPTPEQQSASQITKANLKRKARDEDEKENMQHPAKGGDVTKATKGQLIKPVTKDGITNRPIKSPAPIRRDAQATPANPAAITATRKPLAARNTNEPVNSPKKSTKPGLPGDIGKAKPSAKREEPSKERPVKPKKKLEDVQAHIPTPIETLSLPLSDSRCQERRPSEQTKIVDATS